MERTDSDIVKAHRQGDKQAFAELVTRYMRRVYSFAYRLSNDPSTAEDAASETFIKAWKKLDSFDSTRSFASWIFAIARNATFDILRKKKDVSFSRLAGSGADDDDVAASIPDSRDLADIEFDREVSKEILEESLAKLPIERRAIVILHDIDGLTFEEIGRVMGKPMNTVKSHYRRALLALREDLHQKAIIKRI